jgi:hypothetical protein
MPGPLGKCFTDDSRQIAWHIDLYQLPPTEAALFVDLSKMDHAPIADRGHTRMMASKSKLLTREEFASLLTVGNTCAVLDPPAVIPAKHRARLVRLGYMANLDDRFHETGIDETGSMEPDPWNWKDVGGFLV